MKNLISTTIFGMFILLSETAFSQVPNHHNTTVYQTKTYTGQVTAWETNQDFAYDGFYLTTSGTSMLVKFPPHMGQEITNAIKKGSTVTVNGYMHTNPDGETYFKMVSINASGVTLYDIPPVRHLSQHTETFTNGSGTVSATQTDKRGLVNGFILTNGTILRIPPHNVYQLVNIIPLGSVVQYAGMVHENKVGHAYEREVTIVHPLSITVNGTQYSVR